MPADFPNPNDENVFNPLHLKERDGISVGGGPAKIRPDGKVDQNFRNLLRDARDWDAGRAYVPNETVRYLGLRWVCIADSPAGETPVNNTNWQEWTGAAVELWENTTGITNVPSTPTAIPLELVTVNNPFFTLQPNGTDLTAKYNGIFRFDVYAYWTAVFAGNNQDSVFLVNDATVSGTPNVRLGPLGDALTSPRSGSFTKSGVSFGLASVAVGDTFQLTVQSDAGQTGQTDMNGLSLFIDVL